MNQTLIADRRVPDLPVHHADVDFRAVDEVVLLRPDNVVAWRGTDPRRAGQVRDDLRSGHRALP